MPNKTNLPGHSSGALCAVDGSSVTPNDSTDLPDGACVGLWISAAGSLKITTLAGTALSFPAVPQGYFPFGASRVWATGTSATGIIAAY